MTASPKAVVRVAVLGAGTMGRGIAQLCAQRGLDTHLYDVEKEQLKRAIMAVTGTLENLASKEKITCAEKDAALGRLSTGTDLAKVCRDVDLVVEAAPESMDLKAELFAKVKKHAPRDAVLATNTSSLSITELARKVEATDRVIGLHFFNPPPVMPLLEVVRGLSTPDALVDHALGFAAQLGKEPIVVNDFPGFASSRLGVALGAEAMRMLEQGVARATDIDKAMELGYRHPMGPLKLTDLVGLDVRLAILEHLHREIGEQFRPPTILRQMVRAGRLGKKTRLGFYRWTDDGPVPVDDPPET